MTLMMKTQMHDEDSDEEESPQDEGPNVETVPEDDPNIDGTRPGGLGF